MRCIRDGAIACACTVCNGCGRRPAWAAHVSGAAEVAQAAAELASKQVAAAAAKSFSGRLQRSCRVTSEPAHAPCLLLLRPPPTPFGGSHSPIDAETGTRRRGRAVDVAVGAGAGGGGSESVSEQQPWQSHPNKRSVAQVAVWLISPHVACPQAVRHASGGGGGGAIDLQQLTQ